MVVADCLSRDYIVTKSSDDRTMDDVVLSIEMKQIEFSEDKLKQFQKSTMNDEILNEVLKYYSEGWPTNKKKVKTGEMSNYWSLRNEIVASDGLLYFNDKLIVPRELRQFIMSLLHETHKGMTKTVKRAKTYYYWPGLNSDIENYITKCELCARFQRKQSKE